MSQGKPSISPRGFEQLVRENMNIDAFDFRVEHLVPGEARLRLAFDQRHLRPGGSIAGPVMFSLADTVLYALALSVDATALMSVTTDVSIRFLRRPPPVDLVAEGRLIKPSGRLVVGDVTMFSDGVGEPVCHATGTYLVPRVGIAANG